MKRKPKIILNLSEMDRTGTFYVKNRSQPISAFRPGDTSKKALLSYSQVSKIKHDLFIEQLTLKEVAEKYDIKYNLAVRIRSGLSYINVPIPNIPKDFVINEFKSDMSRSPSRKGEKARNARLKTWQVIIIKVLINNGFSNKQIAEMSNERSDNINNIRTQKSWSHIVVPK